MHPFKARIPPTAKGPGPPWNRAPCPQRNVGMFANEVVNSECLCVPPVRAGILCIWPSLQLLHIISNAASGMQAADSWAKDAALRAIAVPQQPPAAARATASSVRTSRSMSLCPQPAFVRCGGLPVTIDAAASCVMHVEDCCDGIGQPQRS